jgi:hypothetical protein
MSRTDGNHQLYFGEDDPKNQWPPLTASTPFVMMMDLTLEAEAHAAPLLRRAH